MVRSWRRLVIVVGVAIGLLLALAALAAVLVPRDQLAEQIAEGLSEATGAEVMPGSVEWKLRGGLGLRLRDGRLTGSGPELARRTGVALQLEFYDLRYSHFDVSLGLRALLRRQLVIQKVHLVGPELAMQGENGPVKITDFDLQVTDLRLDPTDLEQARGLAPGDRIPADLSFGLTFKAGGLVAGRGDWNSLYLAAVWAQRRFSVTDLTAGVGFGEVALTGSVDYSTDPWGRAEWSLRLRDVPAGSLLMPLWPELAKRWECDLNGEATGELHLKDAQVRSQTLQAKGQLSAGEGVLRTTDWLQDVKPYLGERQDLTTIHFDQMQHSFVVSEGRYQIDTLRLAGPDTDWQAKGWLGFAGDLSVRIGVRLPVGFTPDLGGMSFLAETLRDDEGRVQLGLKLSGRTAAPQFSLDFGSLGGRH